MNILEELVYTYLKHIKKCHIVEKNFFISNQYTTSEKNFIETKEMFDNLSKEYFNVFSIKLFGNETLEKIIKQTEIDLLGLDMNARKIVACETTFQKDGVVIKDSNIDYYKTLAKKIIKIILTYYQYFKNGDNNLEIILIIAKINDKFENEFQKTIKFFETFFNNKITITSIFNTKIGNEIVTPLIKIMDKNNNLNDISMRSLQILNYLKLLKNS